jgi:hypothetical protein
MAECTARDADRSVFPSARPRSIDTCKRRRGRRLEIRRGFAILLDVKSATLTSSTVPRQSMNYSHRFTRKTLQFQSARASVLHFYIGRN